MDELIFSKGKWIIVFQDSEKKHWWDIFTAKGFRHCSALKYLYQLDKWVMIDWCTSGLFIEFLPSNIVDTIIVNVNDQKGAFVEIDMMSRSPRFAPFLPLYCVTAVKELIGLRKWSVITPKQLYCALIRLGAKKIFVLSNP